MQSPPVFGQHVPSGSYDATSFGSQVPTGAQATSIRKIHNISPGYHRVNDTQVNPYEAFSVDQALNLPKRDRDWKHEMRYQIQKVEDNLYIGPWVAAKKPENLQANGITHALAIMQSADMRIMRNGRNLHGVEYNYNGRVGQIKYAEIEFNDRKWVPVRLHIQTFVEALAEARRCGGNLLVYCLQGISQSPTVVIGYLMISRRWMYIEGYRFLHNIRFCIHPNEGFVGQLMEIDKLIKAEDTTKQFVPSPTQNLQAKRRASDDDDDMMT